MHSSEHFSAKSKDKADSRVGLSSKRDGGDVVFDGTNDIGRQGQVCLLGFPILMLQLDGFACRIQNEFFRQSGFGSKMRKLVF